MPNMSIQRIPFTVDSDNRLRMLKARTGITPNILCRMGFCLSLEEPGHPTLMDRAEAAGREINRYTLLGAYDAAYVALLRTWVESACDGDVSDEGMNALFVAHVNRGVELLAARLRVLSDLAYLAPNQKS